MAGSAKYKQSKTVGSCVYFGVVRLVKGYEFTQQYVK